MCLSIPSDHLLRFVAGIASGIVVMCFGFAETYSHFMAITLFFGVVYPGHYAHTITILVDIVPNQLITDFITINVLLIGTGTFVVSIFGGKIF